MNLKTIVQDLEDSVNEYSSRLDFWLAKSNEAQTLEQAIVCRVKIDENVKLVHQHYTLLTAFSNKYSINK